MTRSSIASLFIVFLGCLLFHSCAYDEGEINCDEVRITYSNSIAQIMANNCNSEGCHSQGSYTGDLTTYNGLKEKIETGSFRLRVLELKLMPPLFSAPLSKDDLGKIKCWLESGAPND